MIFIVFTLKIDSILFIFIIMRGNIYCLISDLWFLIIIIFIFIFSTVIYFKTYRIISEYIYSWKWPGLKISVKMSIFNLKNEFISRLLNDYFNCLDWYYLYLNLKSDLLHSCSNFIFKKLILISFGYFLNIIINFIYSKPCFSNR